ncbi:MAG: DUF3592 domain-containing protein [Thermoanaerobaculales bacterium]|nr:DUF3592 domain-containing protein [Thermoanaerobaculales bacterium]
MKISIGTSSESQSGCAGKGFGTIFFGLFFLMGGLFTVFMLGEIWKQAEPWLWPATDCTILSSGVSETGDDENSYRPLVRYRYEVDGQIHESDRFFRSGGNTASFDRARDRAARYLPGDTATCRVSSKNPKLAVLERQFPWIAFVVFFPLIFVVIGGGGLWATWVGFSTRTREVESISQKAASGRGQKFMIGFGLLFIVIGGAVFVAMALLPSIRLAASATWQATPCTVVSSSLRSWSTDDGTSYRADVLYEYRIGEHLWRSNRVEFFGFLSTGYDSAREILGRYPERSSATCWVNPGDPSKSVLERQFRPKQLLGLIPLVFVLAGWAVAHHGWKKMRVPRAGEELTTENVAEAAGPLHLKPQVGPAGKVGGALFFALFWNGIVSVFVWQAWKGWEQGNPDWFLTIFLVPFVLVGLFAIGLIGYFLLAMANPRPRLTITPGRPRLGDVLRLEWKFTGRAARLGNLRIFLEGREEATYQRGTDTITEREVFATLDLVNTQNDWEIPQGAFELTIPSDSMHSFEADANKIIWEIKVEGEILRWPDIDQNFPIRIDPIRIENL